MRRHIIGSLYAVSVVRRPRRQPVKGVEEVPPHIWVGILLDGEGSRRMADKGGQQPFTSADSAKPFFHRGRQIGEAGAAGRYGQGCARLRQHVPLLACQLQLGTALGLSCVALALFTFESIKPLPKLTEYVLEIIEGFIDFFL